MLETVYNIICHHHHPSHIYYGRRAHYYIMLAMTDYWTVYIYYHVLCRCIQFPMSQRDFGYCAATSQIREPRGLSIFLRLRQRRNAKEKRLQNGTGVQRSVGKM